MLKYKVDDKLKMTAKNLNVKIISCKPGSQTRFLDIKGEDYYDVEIEGFKTAISQSLLDILASKTEPPKAPAVSVPETKLEAPKPEPKKEAKPKVKRATKPRKPRKRKSRKRK